MRPTPTPQPVGPGKARVSRRTLRDALAGYAFVAPFLLVYLLFLVYPFARGVWIGMHDWNLLAVVFDPSAKQFQGFENWREMIWGRDLVWSATTRWAWRLAGLAAAAWIALRTFRGRHAAGFGYSLAAAMFVAFGVLAGITTGPEGAWGDPRFYRIVGNTLVFVAATVPAICALALALAIALNHAGPYAATLRTAFFISQVLSVTVVTLIWQLIFSPAQGILANAFRALGLEPITWITNPTLAMPAIVIATVWWSLGFAMVLFLAGLQEIPAERYEAAHLDGAGGWQVFRWVTLPGISRTFTLVVVFEIILHFQVFGQAHLITRGGPNDATQTLVRYIYQSAFRDGQLGYASALAMVLFALMLVFSVIQLRLERRTD
ncbi:MAG: sugar ABC transporter permease [Trueperaceae bacterium]|nr:sugar ABC transporter permease [Trueperaceae bacterium]